MGGFLPYIGTGSAVIIGLLIIGVLYALSLPALVGTVNAIAIMFPAPFAPTASNPSGPLSVPSPAAVILTIVILGLLLGLGRKLLDAPKPRLGSGQRFRTLEGQLEVRGAKNPPGLAAYIGRKKLGKSRLQKLAAAGRRRRAR